MFKKPVESSVCVAWDVALGERTRFLHTVSHGNKYLEINMPMNTSYTGEHKLYMQYLTYNANEHARSGFVSQPQQQ